MGKPLVGIQMYTFRDLTKDDFLGTLRQAGEIGYQAVEFAGFFGKSAKEVRAVLDDTGLRAPSAHIGLNFAEPDKLESDLERDIEYALEVGLEYVITPSAPFPETPTMDDVNRFLSVIETASAKVRAAGLKYGYHNHDFEFKLVEGVAIVDRLLERFGPEELAMEFDLGWVHVAGQRPADYVRKYAGRVPLVHVKDFKQGREDTEIGKGTVDFNSVFDIADVAGIQYYIVEQEQFAGSPLDSAKASLDYFKANGLL